MSHILYFIGCHGIRQYLIINRTFLLWIHFNQGDFSHKSASALPSGQWQFWSINHFRAGVLPPTADRNTCCSVTSLIAVGPTRLKVWIDNNLEFQIFVPHTERTSYRWSHTNDGLLASAHPRLDHRQVGWRCMLVLAFIHANRWLNRPNAFWKWCVSCNFTKNSNMCF